MDSALDCYTDERVELCRGLAFVGVNLRTRILGWMDAYMQHRSAEPNNLSFSGTPCKYGWTLEF